jgi:hypothetical protein
MDTQGGQSYFLPENMLAALAAWQPIRNYLMEMVPSERPERH